MTAGNSMNTIYSRNAFNSYSRKDRAHKDNSTLITPSKSADGVITGNYSGDTQQYLAGTPPTAGKAYGSILRQKKCF